MAKITSLFCCKTKQFSADLFYYLKIVLQKMKRNGRFSVGQSSRNLIITILKLIVALPILKLETAPVNSTFSLNFLKVSL